MRGDEKEESKRKKKSRRKRKERDGKTSLARENEEILDVKE